MTRTVKETYLYKIHRIYEMMVRSIREDLASAGEMEYIASYRIFK